MTIASLLLALLTAAESPRRAIRRPSLSCSTSTPNGAARASEVRPAVEQLIREGYPIKQIDIDRSPSSASRYHVESVPTFIVVDRSGRELDRTSGLQPAAELARFYKTAAAKAQPPANSNAHVGSPRESRSGAGDDDDDSRCRTERPAR